MHTNTTKALIGVSFLLALGACSDRLVPPPELGGSVAQNQAAQIVNPKPVPTDEAPPLNGERDAGALTRYETGKVIKPKDVNTSETSNSGGGGGR